MDEHVGQAVLTERLWVGDPLARLRLHPLEVGRLDDHEAAALVGRGEPCGGAEHIAGRLCGGKLVGFAHRGGCASGRVRIFESHWIACPSLICSGITLSMR